MLPRLAAILGWFRCPAMARSDVRVENLALRQQLAILTAKRPRPRTRAADRLFRVALRRLGPRWEEAPVIIEPDTVVRWHRQGFRKYRTWMSRRRRVGRHGTTAEIRALVERMAAGNPTWGAPRSARSRYRPQREPVAATPRGARRLVPGRPNASRARQGHAVDASGRLEADSRRRDRRPAADRRTSSSLRVAPSRPIVRQRVDSRLDRRGTRVHVARSPHFAPALACCATALSASRRTCCGECSPSRL